MPKESQPHILIIGDNSQNIRHIEELIDDGKQSLNSPIVDKILISDKLYTLKFDVIILIVDTLDNMDILIATIKNKKGIPVILVTGNTVISYLQDKDILSRTKNVIDYLEKDDLNSTLLLKSIQYTCDKSKQQNEFKNLEHKYGDLFHINPLPMWIYDLEFLKFRQVNDAAIQKYGYTRNEFMKMTLRDIRPPEDVIKLEKAISLVREHKKLFSNGIIFRHKKKDGSIIYVELVSNPIFINKVKYEVVIVNDITQSLDYIQAIEKQNLKLQEIAFTHSHIIRAPLTNMMGILDFMKDMDLDSPESTELLDHLLTSCNQLDDKITEVVKKSVANPLSNLEP